MKKKVIKSSIIMLSILIIFFLERFDLKEAGFLIYLLCIVEIFYQLYILVWAMWKKVLYLVAMAFMFLTLSIISITWREPFLMWLTIQSSNSIESKRVNAYICSYRLSKHVLSFDKDTVVIKEAFLERCHYWNSCNQNYIEFEEKGMKNEVRVCFVNDGGHRIFMDERVLKKGKLISQTRWRDYVHKSDTVAIIFGKYQDDYQTVSKTDTVYLYPCKE